MNVMVLFSSVVAMLFALVGEPRLFREPVSVLQEHALRVVAPRAMSGPSNTIKGAMLDVFLGNGSPATVYLTAFTVMPADDGTGGTEVTIGTAAFARVAITNNNTNFPAATAASPSIKKLATQESFPQATADWMSQNPVVGFGFYDAATNGTYLGSAYALSTPVLVTVDPTNETFATGAAHGFVANDAVRFVVSAGATIPAPLSVATTYYVIAAGLAASAFEVSLTQGGAAVNITTYLLAGLMRVFKSFVGPVLVNTTLTINANQLTFQLQGF